MGNLTADGFSVSRRTFLKGLASVGSAAAVVACGSKAETEFADAPIVKSEDLSRPQIYWTTGHHNCGNGNGPCVSKVHVVSGRIVRVTTDDVDYAFDFSLRDKERFDDRRRLTCAKCKSLKWKPYHAGRIKYALKQTKKRGDMTGFVRVDSEVAMKEIATKIRAIYKKYGSGAIHNIYATAGSGTFAACSTARTALTTSVTGSRGSYADYSFHQIYFGRPITGHPNNNTGVVNVAPALKGCVNNVVSFGSNNFTTRHAQSWLLERSVELMKERNPNAKYYFIGPELTDTGVTCATDWVKIRNYTDTALISAMIYHMIDGTFNTDGTIKANPLLDVDYIDTFVYGFFDSPAYWVKTAAPDAGTIQFTEPADTTGWKKVNAIPSGRSWSAYVMGSDSRLTLANYNAGTTYYAKQFSAVQPKRNTSVCSYPNSAGSNTKYKYKKELQTPKTPEWAEKITGVPAATIKELAEVYAKIENHPVPTEWTGGLQKNDIGVVNVFAILSLMCLTKTFGHNAEGFYNATGTPVGASPYSPAAAGRENIAGLWGGANSGGTANTSGAATPTVPNQSCKEWYNGIKFAFYEQLKTNGYTGKHIPEWSFGEANADRFVYDDGGCKAGVKYKRTSTGAVATYTDSETGLTYADWVGRESGGKPVYTGIRAIISNAGGIPVNQHMNCNDSAEMYKCLDLAGNDPNNPDTFLLVQFDPYLSPSARFADYVFPAPTLLEASNFPTVGDGGSYVPPLVPLVGDGKDGWRYAYEAYKAQAELGDLNWTGDDGYTYQKTVPNDLHFRYVKTNTDTSPKFVPAEYHIEKALNNIRNTPGTRFFGKSNSEIFASTYLPTANVATEPTTVVTPGDSSYSALYRGIMSYLQDPDRATKPFVHSATANTSVDASTYSAGNGSNNIAELRSDAPAAAPKAPNNSGKFHVYSDMVVYDYEHKYSFYHGWLPKDRRGQNNKDYEGDPFIMPIPMYMDFEDRFKEAYGLMAGKNTNFDMANALTVGTTHDRFRAHSSMAENPYLRELNHRTVGGGWASGNDWNEFGDQPSAEPGLNRPANPPAMLSTAILNKNRATASWHEVWINESDAAERNIADGDFVQLDNPIGSVRCIARVSKRCVKGHMNLHQGSWYDPNPADGVDDGGCANTIISSKPSMIDNGNSQQWAMATVKKVNF